MKKLKKLISDRRLWLTAGEDQVVEDGDPAAAFLLVAGAGRELPAEVVTRLGLTVSKAGRIKYPGAPKLGKPAEGERAKEADEDGGGKVIKIGGTDDEILEEVADEEGAAEELEEDADDSDRNDEPVPEWTGRTSPEKYLGRYPTGPKADIARAVIAAAKAGADGAA